MPFSCLDCFGKLRMGALGACRSAGPRCELSTAEHPSFRRPLLASNQPCRCLEEHLPNTTTALLGISFPTPSLHCHGNERQMTLIYHLLITPSLHPTSISRKTNPARWVLVHRSINQSSLSHQSNIQSVSEPKNTTYRGLLVPAPLYPPLVRAILYVCGTVI